MYKSKPLYTHNGSIIYRKGEKEMKNKYVCLGCGNIAEFEEGDGRGFVTEWACKCGFLNDIKHTSVKLISAED